jgi:cyclopropane fatty-acyl-phospholipid synthase-like methyltransferase
MDLISTGLLIVIFILVILISIQWPSLTGAPWWPTSFSKVRRMLEMAGVQAGERVYDLGCGDGRVLIIAARRFGAQAVGIEIDPLRFLLVQALITVLGLRKQVNVRLGNFFHQDLSQADVVVTYLLQDTNEQLFEKLHQELRPGTRVVSHNYTYPGWQLLDEDKSRQIYLYRV